MPATFAGSRIKRTMGVRRRLRTFIRGPEPAPIARVSEESVSSAFNRIETVLAEELRRIVAAVETDEHVGYLLLDINPCFAFGTFPVTAWTFDRDGAERDGAMHGVHLLPTEYLLDPTADYPLGRPDWLGVDTMPDVALVERVMLKELRTAWLRVIGSPCRFTALAGVWIADDDGATQPSAMMDLWTGESRVHAFLAAAHPQSC
jgi:hypothetical protein